MAQNVTLPQALTLIRSALSLEEGQSQTLTAQIQPAQADQQVSWSSSDESVATVDTYSRITAQKPGVAVITARSAAYEGLTADCTVAVTPVGQPVIPGDLDKSGEVDIADVMEACKVLARKGAGTKPTADEMLSGNLDGDDDFTIADVMEICKILARKS